MRLDPLESDALTEASYDPETRTLTVEFESGGRYEYVDVEPDLVEQLKLPHPWRRVGDQVKAHRYRRLT
ncbi:hypothetical protein GCM10027416_13370 [Okibacterium endophyticum]